MISGRTSGLMSRFSKSLIHRSGVMAGKSDPNRTLSRSRVLAYRTSHWHGCVVSFWLLDRSEFEILGHRPPGVR